MRKRYPFFKAWSREFSRAYRFLNPYRICKSHLKSLGIVDVHQYGETPLLVYARIAEECAIDAADYWLDLGCGRGEGCFFIRLLTGCHVQGVDWTPQFIDIANQMLKRSPLSKIGFACENMLETDLSKATVIYLFGTCLDEGTIVALCERFEELPSTIKIVTVSYPLSDYHPAFQAKRQFSAQFPWGAADVYLNELSCSVLMY